MRKCGSRHCSGNKKNHESQKQQSAFQKIYPCLNSNRVVIGDITYFSVLVIRAALIRIHAKLLTALARRAALPPSSLPSAPSSSARPWWTSASTRRHRDRVPRTARRRASRARSTGPGASASPAPAGRSSDPGRPRLPCREGTWDPRRVRHPHRLPPRRRSPSAAPCTSRSTAWPCASPTASP